MEADHPLREQPKEEEHTAFPYIFTRFDKVLRLFATFPAKYEELRLLHINVSVPSCNSFSNS